MEKENEIEMCSAGMGEWRRRRRRKEEEGGGGVGGGGEGGEDPLYYSQLLICEVGRRSMKKKCLISYSLIDETDIKTSLMYVKLLQEVVAISRVDCTTVLSFETVGREREKEREREREEREEREPDKTSEGGRRRRRRRKTN